MVSTAPFSLASNPQWVTAQEDISFPLATLVPHLGDKQQRATVGDIKAGAAGRESRLFMFLSVLYTLLPPISVTKVLTCPQPAGAPEHQPERRGLARHSVRLALPTSLLDLFTTYTVQGFWINCDI
jgi:hypothetical protein